MLPTPLPFAEPRLSDAPLVRHAARAARQSDVAFANLYLLRRKYGTELALEGGVLYRYYAGRGRLQGYAFPCGAVDARAALARVEEDALARGRELRFCLLTDEQVSFLEGCYPGRFVVSMDRGDADYVYERRALAELPGARFHRKRNHVGRFMRECPTWNMRGLTRENAADALAVAAGWLAGRVEEEGAAPPALLHEYEAISQALSLREELGLVGLVLYVGAEPVGMTLVSMLSPQVADVHYEKCLPSFRGGYALLCQMMAQQLDCAWLNREEDLNDEGLRQAKLAYFPSELLLKYSAVLC